MAIETDGPMLSRALHELYGCPREFAEFELNGELSSEVRYFELGAGVAGYGRLWEGVQTGSDGGLRNVLSYVRSENGTVHLPFSPDEVIENLRLERYAHGSGGRWQESLRSLYYAFRPIMTGAVRRGIQKFCARNWHEIQFPRWPVDTSVEGTCRNLLLSSLRAKNVAGIPFIWFWPGGAKACATMTHDVETENGRGYCEELMDVDDDFGIKASFQLVPEGRYAVASGFLDKIRERGFEIGVQDLNHDGRLFDDAKEFLSRVKRINRYGEDYRASGFRAGVLYRKPEWYSGLEFQYDMSIPNVAHLDPQRGGCCTVMPYFIGKILELPVTTIQDYSLFYLLGDYSIDLWKAQVECIRENNGLAMFIVHPDYVRESGAMNVYRQLLAYLVELRRREQWWIALPREINAWWRARASMSLVKDGMAWRIEGDRCEEAVLAFARERDGRLYCDIPSSKKMACLGASSVQ